MNHSVTTSRSTRLHNPRNSPGLPLRTAASTTTNTSNSNANVPLPQITQHQCCGVVEEAAFQAREKRAMRTRPQPWISRKLMVGVTLGIMGYTGYVYIQRFCISIIKQTSDAVSRRSTGVILLVIFCVLYLWMIWAYIKVILTPPGYARDYVSPEPLPEAFLDQDRSSIGNQVDLSSSHCPPDLENRSSTDFDPIRTHRYKQPSYSSTHSHQPSYVIPKNDIAGPSYEDIGQQASIPPSPKLSRISHGHGAPETRNRSVDVFEDDGGVEQGKLRTPRDPPFSCREEEIPSQSRDKNTVKYRTQIVDVGFLEGTRQINDSERRIRTDSNIGTGNREDKHPTSKRTDAWKIIFFPCACLVNNESYKKPELPVRRMPSNTPILHPAWRYCHQEGFVKPYRTHHCRNCGTCILKFDHHCPWIGQCVGARNHKFFFNFCQAALIFTLYVFATLVGFNAPAWSSEIASIQVDPQVIVICALAALFALFTGALTLSHTLLILKGQTTVENMSIRTIKEREAKTLTREYGWFAPRAKCDAQRQWNEEWGDLETEGNLWWTGSKKQGWLDVMGTNPFGWILPIGRSVNDGLSHPVNPRFDEQGRQRRRIQWPAELR